MIKKIISTCVAKGGAFYEFKKFLSMIMVLSMTAAVFTGCGSSSDSTSDDSAVAGKKEQKIIPVKRILQRAIKKNLLSGISIQELRQMLFRIW